MKKLLILLFVFMVNIYCNGFSSGFETTGNMRKKTYDTDKDDLIDDADKLDGETGSYYTDFSNQTVDDNEITPAKIGAGSLDTDVIASSVAASLITTLNIKDDAVTKDKIANTGTLGFDWINGDVVDDLTIDNTGSVDKRALGDSGGTLSFDWADEEVVDDLTINTSRVLRSTGVISTGDIDATGYAVYGSSFHLTGSALLLNGNNIINGDGSIHAYTNNSSAITVGTGAVGINYKITFDGETSDGVIEWDYAFPISGRFLIDCGMQLESIRLTGYLCTDEIQVGTATAYGIKMSSNVSVDGNFGIKVSSPTAGLQVSSSTTSGYPMSFGGCHDGRPTSGFDAGTLAVDISQDPWELIFSTEAVKEVESWITMTGQ